jgi:aryl-phospho-beta-D-glucosidase BglC (GH1 family)
MKIFEGYQRGINLGGWISQCNRYEKDYYETFIVEKDIETIAGWGLDHVRVPVDYEVLEDEQGNYIEEGFGYISNCIAWCQKYNLHMILDLHKTAGYSFDIRKGEDADSFFRSEELQQRFIRLWKEFAQRYGQFHQMLAFELLNEIVDPGVEKEWNAIARKTIEAIRQIAPDTYILIGGVNYNSVTSIPQLDLPYDDKIVYNFHCYEPLVFTHQKAYWVEGMTADFDMSYPAPLEEYREKSRPFSKESMGVIYTEGLKNVGTELFEELFKKAVETAEERNVALYCGEYGVIDQAPLEDTVRWYQDIHDVFQKHGIGHAAWTYKDKDFGLTDEHYQPVREKLIALL